MRSEQAEADDSARVFELLRAILGTRGVRLSNTAGCS